MKRRNFIKSIFGLAAIATNAKEIAKLSFRKSHTATFWYINKSYVSAIDPILDMREIDSMIIDTYNEDALVDILRFDDKKKINS